jgi:protein TonB
MKPGLTLFQGIFVSMLIHGALVAPVFVLRLAGDGAPVAPRAELLDLDFLGIKSKKQVEEKISGDEEAQEEKPPIATAAAPPPPTAQPRARKERAPKAAPPPKQAPEAREEQVADDPSSQTRIEAFAPPPPVATAAPEMPEQNEPPRADAPGVLVAPQAVRAPGAEMDQRQQSLEDEKKKNEEAIRQYLAKLHRAISPYVKFPPEARNLTATAMPKVRFRVDEGGHIVDDRVEILLSSGHPALDQAAIRATRHGAPFPNPPRAMTIAMRIEFSVK